MGTRSAAELGDRIVSYAQNREDVILAGFFKDDNKGVYVDVGANDPVYDSVTKYFYNLGWRGINIEPIKSHYEKLVKDRPRDTNLNIGIGERPGKLQLRVYDNGDGLSTFSEELKKDYSRIKSHPTANYHDVAVEVKTLSQVLEDSDVASIQFMKVDVEGYEYQVLVGNDWKKFRPEVLCIEANHIEKDWRPLLKENNYSLVFFDGLNEYYVAKEAKHRAEAFSYVESVIGRSIISLNWNNRLEALHKEHNNLKSQQKSLTQINKDLERTVEVLNAHIHHNSRFKSLVKNLILKIDGVILLQVSKLAKKQHYYPTIRIDRENGESPKDLLAAIRKADSASIKGSRSLKDMTLAAIGSCARWSYLILRRLGYKTPRAIYRTIKKLKGKMR